MPEATGVVGIVTEEQRLQLRRARFCGAMYAHALWVGRCSAKGGRLIDGKGKTAEEWHEEANEAWRMSGWSPR